MPAVSARKSMATNHMNPGASATPDQDSPTHPNQAGRKTAPDDNSEDSDKEAPDPPHGHVSHGKARFLLWVGEKREEVDGFDPDLSTLGDLYDDWRDSSNQTDVSRWCE